MKKGFTVIEILMSMMILFSAIVLVNMSIQTYNDFQRKSIKYQNFYTTALSLKDWISMEPLNKTFLEGSLNNLNYRFDIKKVKELKNYNFTMEVGYGNNGSYLISLYEINMHISNKTHEKEFNFFLTKQVKLK